MHVASQKVEIYNNLILVNFIKSNGAKAVIIVLAKSKTLIITPIIVSAILFFIAKAGKRGENIE